MKKRLLIMLSLVLALSIVLAGCGDSGDSSESPQGTPSSDVSQTSDAGTPSDEETHNTPDIEENDTPDTEASELITYFGDDGPSFVMHLEDNDTAAAIAGYVGTTEWRLPVYSYDESDVMEYYDIPSRYEIPDNSVQVTQAHAGDVFYSNPNRIVLYYRDAEIDEEYTKIGSFDATEEFVSAVENNPVLEGWDAQIVLIRAEE